jgi:large subunit ribosomal protein L29
MNNSFKDLRYPELITKREELKKKYLDLRFDMVVHHVDNPLERRNIRRQLARLHTIIHEYALGIRKQTT